MLELLKRHKSKAWLAFFAGSQVLLNFGTNVLVVHDIGFVDMLDVFYIASSVYAFLFTSVGWSLNGVMTALFVEKANEKPQGKTFVNVALVCVSIAIGAALSMPLWGKLLYVNYLDSVDFSTIIGLQYIFLLMFAMETLALVLSAVLHAKYKFITVAAVVALGCLVSLIFVWLTLPIFGIFAAAWGQVLVKLVQFIVLWNLSRDELKGQLRFCKASFIDLWHRVKHLALSGFYSRSEELAERFIASFLSAGFLSLAAFVQRVYGAILNVLAISVTVPTLTMFADLIKIQNYSQLRKSFWRNIGLCVVIGISGFAGVAVLGEWLFMQIFAQRVPAELVSMLPHILTLLFMVVFSYTVDTIAHNLLLALGKNSTIAIFNMAVVSINLTLKIGLTIQFGMYGFLSAVALGEVIRMLTKLGAAWYQLEKLA